MSRVLHHQNPSFTGEPTMSHFFSLPRVFFLNGKKSKKTGEVTYGHTGRDKYAADWRRIGRRTQAAGDALKHGAAAAEHAWGAAPGAHAGGGNDHRLHARDRLPAPGHGKDFREPSLYGRHPLYGQFRLPFSHAVRNRLRGCS